MMERLWTSVTTLAGRLLNITLGFGVRTSPITTLTRGDAVSSPPGFPPSQYDIVRINSFKEGAQTMKDKLIADVTWFADDAPNSEAANHMWKLITHLMGVTVQPGGKQI